MKSYDFTLVFQNDNPDFDIELFLKDIRPTFQKYIEHRSNQMDIEKQLLKSDVGGDDDNIRLENNGTFLQDSNMTDIITPESYMSSLPDSIVSII